METQVTDYTVHANGSPAPTTGFAMVNLVNQSGSKLINQNGDYLIARVTLTGISLFASETNYTIHG